MTEWQWQAYINEQRLLAHCYLGSMLIAWRRELWPDVTKDPIYAEQRKEDLRKARARYPSIDPFVSYYGGWSLNH